MAFALCALSLVGLVSPPVQQSAIVVGGSGRVGGSTVRWLEKLSAREGILLKLAVGGRSISSFEAARRRMEKLGMDVSALFPTRGHPAII